MTPEIRAQIQKGAFIPAHPLALDSGRRMDERRQRALTRYYLAAGVGGLAVGVHTTQFAIRDPKHGLLEPVLQLAMEEGRRVDRPLIMIAGLCGETHQAVREAERAHALGYDAGLLSLAALGDASVEQLIAHCRAVAAAIPVVGFYLQPAVGGRVLPVDFWRRFAEIEAVVAIKIAPFNRYQTLDVIRAVSESGRDDLALYTGNDDNILLDLLTPFRFECQGRVRERRIVGGLLGHWAVWTERAVALFHRLREMAASGQAIRPEVLAEAVAVTDANAAFFDAANGFQGCIAGLHEVLRRQGLLEGVWCLDPDESLSPDQADEIDRVTACYPQLDDTPFVQAHRDAWLAG